MNCNSGTSTGTALSEPRHLSLHNDGRSPTRQKKLHRRIFTMFCTVAHRTCLWDITAMSNSVDELRARHNHCHVNGLLELAVHGHRDVTVEGHEEARHLVHCPQGHELVPERLQVHKAMTLYLGGSKSPRALEELPRRQKKNGKKQWPSSRRTSH